ncbi:hypothetical protein DNTS_014589 [Danionella cerebrum]|uniref:Uncharacterized protein n=1 Tax=Danionella cerebrum TaxID=2873325 RepID=A0A553Q7A1_9TELE|nr:hypothetical protein DNTS_014589 [Danionella translucida]
MLEKAKELWDWLYSLEAEKFEHMEKLKRQKYEVTTQRKRVEELSKYLYKDTWKTSFRTELENIDITAVSGDGEEQTCLILQEGRRCSPQKVNAHREVFSRGQDMPVSRIPEHCIHSAGGSDFTQGLLFTQGCTRRSTTTCLTSTLSALSSSPPFSVIRYDQAATEPSTIIKSGITGNALAPPTKPTLEIMVSHCCIVGFVPNCSALDGVRGDIYSGRLAFKTKSWSQL